MAEGENIQFISVRWCWIGWQFSSFTVHELWSGKANSENCNFRPKSIVKYTLWNSRDPVILCGDKISGWIFTSNYRFDLSSDSIEVSVQNRNKFWKIFYEIIEWWARESTKWSGECSFRISKSKTLGFHTQILFIYFTFTIRKLNANLTN